MQYTSKSIVVGEADIFHRLIETSDRPLVHLLVESVAAVNTNDRSLITKVVGIGRRSAKRLNPVGSKTLGMLRVESVAERMADNFVLHHSRVPRASQPQ